MSIESTEITAADYSFARPRPTSIKAAGHRFVERYLRGSGKALTAAERDELHTAGLGIGVVDELTANRSTAGRAAGVADANAALAAANAIGVPAAVPIFTAVDFDAAWEQVGDYLLGWLSVLGNRAGAYGSATITKAARAAGFKWTWQTVAWSRGVVDHTANLYQRASMTRPVDGCDENVVLNDFPIWGPDGVVGALSNAPVEPATPSGEDMAIAISVKAGDTESIAVPDGTTKCRVVVTAKAGNVRTVAQLADGSLVPLLKGQGDDPFAWYAAGNPMTFDLTAYGQPVVAIFVTNVDANVDPVGVTVW